MCEISGVCWGGEHVEELFDNQMNRRSSNPDAISGCITFVGYRSKRDASALSEMATLAASNFTDVENTLYEAPRSPQREAPKRGARCVGEMEDPRPKRRSRTCKRDVEDVTGTRNLVEDAVMCTNSKFCCALCAVRTLYAVPGQKRKQALRKILPWKAFRTLFLPLVVACSSAARSGKPCPPLDLRPCCMSLERPF